MTQRRWRYLAWAITLLIVIACLLPPDDLPELPGSHLDKLQHLTAFFLLGFAWHRSGLSWLLVLVVGVALGFFTEFGQHLLRSGRTGDAFDLLADLGGVAAGVLASRLLGGTEKEAAPTR